MTAPRWYPAYIGLGSNLQQPAKQIAAAFDALDNLAETRLVARSSLYRSAPLGGVEQPDFLNAVAAVLTRLQARVLLEALLAIELRQGRERGAQRWGPRVLDLDMLAFSDRIIAEDGLSVPHPGIAKRNFVLLPLREIAPELVIPGLGRIASIDVNAHEPRIERIA